MLVCASHLGSIEEIENGLRWDAAMLGAEIDRRAAQFSRLEVVRSSRVAIACGGGAEFFADLLAVWRLGATAICLDPALTPGERENILAFAKPDVVLMARDTAIRPMARSEAPSAHSPLEGDECDGHSIPRLARGAHDPTSLPGREPTEAKSHAQAWTRGPPAPGDPALVLFTSGTTAAPKGVVLSFGAIAARIASNVAQIGEGTLARTLITLPTHFGHGLIGNALTPLLSGGTIVVPPGGTALAKDLGRLIDRHRIGFLTSVPALWRVALKFGAAPQGDTLRRVHVGSAPLSAALWSDVAAWSRCETVNCYGMTETANWFSGASSREAIAEGLVGAPWEGAAAVRDAGGAIGTSGEGEIVVRSTGLMSCYLGRPDLTAAVLQDGWYRTGDCGWIDPTGRIRLTGRIKDEINRAGFKVQPAEIDVLLETHPAVAEACVFAVPDPVGGESIAAAVRLASGASATSEMLRAWCRQRLRREAVPEHWFFVREMPRNARGKVSRDAVRRTVTSGAA